MGFCLLPPPNSALILVCLDKLVPEPGLGWAQSDILQKLLKGELQLAWDTHSGKRLPCETP